MQSERIPEKSKTFDAIGFNNTNNHVLSPKAHSLSSIFTSIATVIPEYPPRSAVDMSKAVAEVKGDKKEKKEKKEVVKREVVMSYKINCVSDISAILGTVEVDLKVNMNSFSMSALTTVWVPCYLFLLITKYN